MATKNTEKGLTTVNSFAALEVGSNFGEIVAANIGNAQVTPFDLDRVHVPAGGGLSWEVPTLTGIEQQGAIDGAIVAWRRARAMWRIPYSESGGGTPPDCSSEDGEVGIGDPGGICSRCPLSKFGSAANGRAQACNEMRMLFVIRENDSLPLVVTVAPSSLGNINKYFLRLVSSRVPYYGVLTRLRLEKARNKDGIQYSQIVPELISVLPDEEQARVKAYADGLRPLFAATQIIPERDNA